MTNPVKPSREARERIRIMAKLLGEFEQNHDTRRSSAGKVRSGGEHAAETGDGWPRLDLLA